MLKLKYLLPSKVNVGTDAKPVWAEQMRNVEMPYNENNVEIAKSEASDGKYEIFDDGQYEPDNSTTDDVLNALLGVRA